MDKEQLKGMQVEEPKCFKPPWIFRGRALYQFHLVKAEIARAIIPKHFRLVEAFGYTLGGFFLANYNDSPFGSFDELVVMAGIVWNPPTSHAWAARVYVNSDGACRHGRKEFGLPSQVATFSKRKGNGLMTSSSNMDILQVVEMNGGVATHIGQAEASPVFKWMGMGLAIKMSLPSFSGHTEHKPELLKYCCQIKCKVRPTSPATVIGAAEASEKRDVSMAVMLSKPILALEFNCLNMQVEPPVVVSKLSHGFSSYQSQKSHSQI